MKKLFFAITLLFTMAAASNAMAQCPTAYTIEGPNYSCENVPSGEFIAAFTNTSGNTNHNIILNGFQGIVTLNYAKNTNGLVKMCFNVEPTNVSPPYNIGSIQIETTDNGCTVLSPAKMFIALDSSHPACP